MNELVLRQMYLTMGRPRPVPSQFWFVSSVYFSSKIKCNLSAGMPFPLSCTSIDTYSWSSTGFDPIINQLFFNISLSNFSTLNLTWTNPNCVCLSEFDIKLLVILLTLILWTHNLTGKPGSETKRSEFEPFLASLVWVRLRPLMKSTLSSSLLTSLTSMRWCDLNSILKLSNMSVRSSSSLLQHSLT